MHYVLTKKIYFLCDFLGFKKIPLMGERLLVLISSCISWIHQIR